MKQQKPVRLSTRVKHLQPSPIRDILAVIDHPDMISFAGGLPAAETFPVINAAIPREFLQYGPSEGEPELRNQVARILRDRGLVCGLNQVLILSGSQQGIDLAGKLFIDHGTEVAVESPTYLAGIQVFRFYGAKFVDIRRITTNTVLTYVNPTFQNPTGYCYTEQERDAVANLCDRANSTLFEDDPYHDLAYDSSYRIPICAKVKTANWIYQSSFSKSLSPGLRVGFMACSHDLIQYLTQLKQAADLHTNRPGQYHVIRALKDQADTSRLDGLTSFYRRRRDQFDLSLRRSRFKNMAEWVVPTGGLFFWLKLNPEYRCDTRELLSAAISQNVAFMPGEYFYINSEDSHPYIRLNFSHATPAQAETGLRRLARIFEKRF